MADDQVDNRVTELLQRLPLLRQWQEQRASNHAVGRAFIIEFAGMPKAGKSTAIEDVRHFFSHGHKDKHAPKPRDGTLKYRVHTPAEGVSLRTPSALKDDQIDFNSWAGAYAVQELIQACHDAKNDLVVLDRGPWDAGCWLEFHATTQEHGEGNGIRQKVEFFQLDDWMLRADLHVLLLVNPAEARNRERNHRLVEHGGFSSHLEGMEAMYRIYSRRFEKLVELKTEACAHVGNRSALCIDTTNLERKDVATQIISAAFDVLDAKVENNQSEFTFTNNWVKERVLGYLPNVRGRSKAMAFLDEFVERANSMSPQQRETLKKLLEESRAPEAHLLKARATLEETVSAVQRELEALLRKASR